mgnify:CR=1 FL=1
MGLVTGLLKMFFGTKSDKDRKEIEPYVNKIKEIYPQIEQLSNDELRAHSAALQAAVAAYIADDEAQITDLKAKLENMETSLDEKEEISRKIDHLTEEIDRKIEEKLDEILPEAFAIMKDTARRFTQNSEVVVTATDFDRDLAAEKDFIRIEGDKAIYSNSWTAGGNKITWDMIHYDCQLFGGVVLHKGKIAEMATGEGKTLVATLPVFLNALAKKGVHMVTVNDYLARRDSEWMGPLYQFHGLSVDCIDKHKPNSAARRKAYMADITFGTNNEFGFDYLRDNMSISPDDLVQRKHHFAIVDEVDSVLIDDARTPLIISGPVPKGDDQMFEQYRGAVENLFNLQRNLVTQLLADAKRLISEGKTEEGSVLLYRAHKGLPKYKPLIKFLSEPGMKAMMLKTENIYMQDNNRRMPEIVDDLYFVIDEKLNSVELQDKGHEALSRSVGEDGFFVLPDIGSCIADIEKENISGEEKAAKKDAVLNDYAIRSERVHTVNQLLKAYSMFEKDVEYVVIDNKVKIVDEQTGRILEGRRYSDGLHQAIEAKERVKVEAATQTFATVTLQNYFRMYHKLAGMTGTAETEASEFWNIYKLDVVVIPTNRPVIRDDKDDLIYRTKREKYAAVIEEIDALIKQGRPVLVGTTSVEISELLSRMLKLRGIKHNVLNAKQHQLEAQIVAEAGQTGQVTIATNMAGRGTDIKLGEGVLELGGLCVIGTERHESRRIDNQLRGRAGRQGDPGESQFYLSLEDELMRRFGSDRIKQVLERLNADDEDIVIKSRMLTRQVEAAQKRVEGNNYDTRKQVLQYDDVMREQREIIYAERYDVITAERDLEPEIKAMIKRTINRTVDGHSRNDQEEALKGILNFARQALVPENAISLEDLQEVGEVTKRSVNYDAIKVYLNELADDVYDRQIKKLRSEEAIREFQKVLILMVVDNKWTDHIDALDQLRNAVGLRGYAQNNPIVEYQSEGFKMFQDMIGAIEYDVTRTMMKAQIHEQSRENVNERVSTTATGNIQAHQADANGQEIDFSKVGRNDFCPCGSGKKFKNCHGRKQF